MKKKEIVRRVMEKLGQKEKERRRKKRIMGYDAEEHIKDDYLAALSRGVIKDECEGSPIHGPDGKFDSWDSDGSWALPDRAGCRKGGQFKRKKKSRQGDREPCGRKSKESPRKLCKEDSGYQETYNVERLKSLIRNTITTELQKLAKANDCTVNDIMKFVNRYEKAEKGTLFKSDNKAK